MLNVVTLGVRDKARSRVFYDSLGWVGSAGEGDDPVFYSARGMVVAAVARAAGGVVARDPAPTFWGGYSSIILDPDGHPWEIAHNPHWRVDADGGVTRG